MNCVWFFNFFKKMNRWFAVNYKKNQQINN